MRVAHLTTVDSSLRFLLLAQLEAVIAQGGEAVGISAPGPFVADLEEAGVGHRALPSSTRGMNPMADLRAARQLWRLLRAEKFDVLHTHNPKPGLYGRVLGRLAGVPIVVHTTHGLYAAPDDGRLKRALVYALEAVASRFSDLELVQNPEDLALMARLRLVPPQRARLLGNGVDLARFDPERFGSGPRARLRHELGFGVDQVVVGAVGRLVAEKGYAELLDATARLSHDYGLMIVGPEDPEKADALPHDLVEAARARGVRFLGLRADVDELYSAMDVFVLPSHREGLPRAAIEAAAMGLPIVATDIRGCRQVVEHGVNGLLVPVGDVTALADAVGRLAADDALRTRMGEAGRTRAGAHFDEREVVRIVLEAYQELADRKARGGRARRRAPEPTRPPR